MKKNHLKYFMFFIVLSGMTHLNFSMHQVGPKASTLITPALAAIITPQIINSTKKISTGPASYHVNKRRREWNEGYLVCFIGGFLGLCAGKTIDYYGKRKLNHEEHLKFLEEQKKRDEERKKRHEEYEEQHEEHLKFMAELKKIRKNSPLLAQCDEIEETIKKERIESRMSAQNAQNK